MPLKLVTAAALSVAAAASTFATDVHETARVVPQSQHYMVESVEPLAPADVMFGRSLHVTQTDSFARDGKHYLAMRAPTRSALDAFLKGTGRATAPVTQ